MVELIHNENGVELVGFPGEILDWITEQKELRAAIFHCIVQGIYKHIPELICNDCARERARELALEYMDRRW